MNSETMRQLLSEIEAELALHPSSIEFEMAYQTRVAIDRIKFAIKHTEQFAPQNQQVRDAELQLLDALERLESVDRRFQQKTRKMAADLSTPNRPHPMVNGSGLRR